MTRVLLLLSLALVAAGCGGGSGSAQIAPTQPRTLSAPDVEPTPSTTLAPLERIVLGEQTPTFEPPTLGTVFSFATARDSGGACGNFFALMLDPATWSDGDQTDELITMIEPFGPPGAEIATGLDGTEIRGIDALEAIDSLTMQECGLPGGGMFFVIAGTTAMLRSCSVDVELAPEECGTDADQRFHPTTFPCLIATGLGWRDTATGVGPVYGTVDCDTNQDVFWDPDAPGWFTSTDTTFGN